MRFRSSLSGPVTFNPTEFHGMFSQFWFWLFPKTTDGVLKTFHSAIADLHRVTKHHNAAATTARVEANRLHDEADASEYEAGKAHAVRRKIEALVA